MKIAIGSDLHLEFGALALSTQPSADVLVLAGDVLVAQDLYKSQRHQQVNPRDLVGDTVHARARDYRQFLDGVSAKYPHVVYIAGNHEHYHGVWERTHGVLRMECGYYPNIHFLENQSWTHQDVTFLGCTLWTDFNRDDPISRYHVRQNLNDYREIRDENFHRINTDHTYYSHRHSMKWLDGVVRRDGKTVVITHMAPHPLSCHPNYVTDTLSHAYYSNLDEWMIQITNPLTWIHGHTHYNFDYTVGPHRVICNPRGYRGIDAAQNYQFKVIQL